MTQSYRACKMVASCNFFRALLIIVAMLFCYSDEENGHYACTNGHLTTANQSEICKEYLVSVQ